MKNKGYKVLLLTDKGLKSPVAGKTYQKLGDWTKEVVKPRMCRSGWHLWDTRPAAERMFRDYASSSFGNTNTVLMFAAEGKGFHSRVGDYNKKSVYRSVRLTKLLKVHIPTAAVQP